MSPSWLWLGLGACHKPTPLPTSGSNTPPGDTASTGIATSATGATGGTGTTGETGLTIDPCAALETALGWPTTATDYAIPPVEQDFALAPSVRIVGFPRSNLGNHLEVLSDTPGVGRIIAGTSGSLYTGVEHPTCFVLDGDLPRGEHKLCEVWDGVSGYMGSPNRDIAMAGDVNGDGHLDVWLDSTLFPGPLEHRLYVAGADAVGQIARFDRADKEVMGGAFDADGDGHLDALQAIDDQQGELYYGPLEGVILDRTDPAGDPSRWTTFGTSWCESYSYPTLLVDHLGPGHHAVSIGKCYGRPSAYLWDLMQPRGAALGYDDAFATAPRYGFGLRVTDAGDLDGDGFGDLLVGGWDDAWSWLIAGPSSGEVVSELGVVTAPNREVVRQRDGYVSHVIGDLNGDGVAEFLGVTSNIYRVVLFSPHTDPMDVGAGMRLVSPDHTLHIEAIADIDGDALPDVVYRSAMLDDEMGELGLWYGADLLAAWVGP